MMARSLRLGACAATLAIALGGAAMPAFAQDRHDGVWKVKTSAEDGKCSTNYDFSLAVKNGKVSYAGMWPVKAAGGIKADGLIKMNISHGKDHVVATGLVRGDQASGEWTSPKPACSGSWIASRKG